MQPNAKVDFKQICQSKQEKSSKADMPTGLYSTSKEKILWDETAGCRELIEKKIGGSANWIHCWLTFIDAQLGGTIFPCLYSPYLLYILFSYGSGQVKTRCGNEYGNIRLIMFVYVGITSGLDPIVDFDGCSFVGLCLYAGYAEA